MPSLWITSPAWGRYSVTRLALAQRRHLCDVLTSRGLDAHGVIIANDENLELAREYGFETVEMDNRWLGGRFNAGFEYAAKQGADYIVHVGADNWVHPDFFEPLLDETIVIEVYHPGPVVLTGRRVLIVNLHTGMGKFVQAKEMDPSHFGGFIPFLIPRAVLEACSFAPLRPRDWDKPIDPALIGGLQLQPSWIPWEPNLYYCVDWKTEDSITPYRYDAPRAVYSPEAAPWSILGKYYPAELVALAEKTHRELAKPEDPGESDPEYWEVLAARVRRQDPEYADRLIEDGY